MRKKGIIDNAVAPLQSLQELIEINRGFPARMGNISASHCSREATENSVSRISTKK